MKNVLVFVAVLALVACKGEKKEPATYSKEILDVTTSIYPENITKVFDAHGGIDHWNTFKSLKFIMNKPNGAEVITTDLKKRYSFIEMPNHNIGYDGDTVWLKSKDATTYQGNPKFYYNLMFYFYAMPFILADDGIIYEDAEALERDGNSYPGIKISYEAGIGESPDDEYIIYYDPETYKMSWLSYTVTYFTQEKSKEFHYIKYSNWQEIEGLLLPETLTWYNYENNVPTTERNQLQFTNVKLSKEAPAKEFFEVPEGAQIIY